MRSKNLPIILLVASCLSSFLVLQSCGTSYKKEEASLSNMNKEEAIRFLKNEGFTILSPNDENLYYVNTDSLFFYDIKNDENILVFRKDSTKINLYELALNISRDGDIEVIKRYVDKRWITVGLNLNLIKGIKDTQKFDTRRIYGKDGFIIEYDNNTALINPKEDGSIDAIIIYGDDAVHESYVEYDVPVIIGYNFDFDWSDIPNKFRPTLSNEALTFGLVQDAPRSNHPRYIFHYSAMLNSDGSIKQGEFIDFAHLDYTVDKALFKNKLQLQAYIEQYADDMTSDYNEYVREQQLKRIINEANPISYYLNLSKNRNLFKSKVGQTVYVNDVVVGVGEKNEYSGYRISFDGSKLLDLWGNMYGYSTDDRFATLSVPQRIIAKATLADGEWDVFFKDIEIITTAE